MAWDKTCRPKCEGGLGIRRTEDINATYLAKRGWKVPIKPNNLWFKIIRAKYLGNNINNFFKVRKNITSSFAWKSIVDQRNLIKKGLNGL